MIAAANNGNGGGEKPLAPTVLQPVTHGGEWGGYFNARHYRRQARQIRLLVKAGAIAAAELESIIKDAKELARLCKDGGDVRGWVSLTGLVVEIAKHQAEAIQDNGTHNHLHMHADASVNQPQQFDPDYAEFLRARAIAGDLHPGVICPNGKPGQVAVGKPSSGNGSSHNGNGNGNGKH